MAKSKSPSTNSLIFGGILTGFAAIAVVGLICIILFGLGYYLIVKYNKPGTWHIRMNFFCSCMSYYSFFIHI